MTKSVFSEDENRVLILGTIASQHFRGKLSTDDPLLFVLETDEQKVFFFSGQMFQYPCPQKTRIVLLLFGSTILS